MPRHRHSAGNDIRHQGRQIQHHEIEKRPGLPYRQMPPGHIIHKHHQLQWNNSKEKIHMIPSMKKPIHSSSLPASCTRGH